MFGHENFAWLKNISDEANFINAMRLGSNMDITATSRRGNQTQYSFSLTVVTAMLREVQKCG